MRRIEFGIGIGKDHNKQSIPPILADSMLRTALSHIALFSDGGFVARGFGYWRDPSGKVVREDAITITFDANLTDGTIQRLARVLRCIFSQTAIHVAIMDVDAHNT